jgi:hypothetical protein
VNIEAMAGVVSGCASMILHFAHAPQSVVLFHANSSQEACQMFSVYGIFFLP